ncbi:PPE family protein, SVP subgroup [Mycobacterium vicinigordonae]|uniref:PPE domain-containing protein n=1 Tax=Mycobacterium vicinigordonae TaxID=1719132 RepID=A0A7D6IR67_9MYCO|nr:PPE domain-containing protein [Mycobacterium vicinigordonae]QLL06839.1 PPE domain-containing protein [Mycobacterium vicinigordonae]
MYFAAIPPEVNSGRMYTGPGSAPMLAAAEAWESLAAELHSAASSYQAVVSGLVAGPWLGPTSMTMAGAASNYVAWLGGAAAQAEETADQATAAAAAFESAFAATVPPEVVAANRSLLAALVATNLLGQNTPAIAATEAQYLEMWAQDAAAMYGYAGSSAAATQLTPFLGPQQATSPSAAAGQSVAVSQAANTAAGTAQGAVSQVAQVFSAVPDALSGLAASSPSAAASLSPLDLLDIGADLIAFLIDAPVSPLGVISLPIDIVGAQTGLHTDDIVSGWADESTAIPGLTGAKFVVPPQTIAAGIGEANSVGALSVPPTWTAATPAVRPVALALPANFGIDQQALTASLSNSVDTAAGDMALATAAGRAVGDTVGGRGRQVAQAATRGQKPAAENAKTETDEKAEHEEPRTVVTGIAAEIREFARLRDEGLITDQQFVEQRNRLLDL